MDPFFIIVGLGNPGRKYDGTRHNVGFDVIDELVDRFHIGGPEKFGKSMIGKGRIGDRKVILVKPMTYMNLSGEAVQEIVHYFKADPEQDLVIISDDIDLQVGQLRIRKKGSAGGHNGLKNIVQHLGSGNFARIRVGVGGKPDPDFALMDYVLGHFSGDDKKVMEEAVSKAADAVACMVTEGAAKDVVEAFKAGGVLTCTAGEHVVRFLPTLSIREDHLEEAVEMMGDSLEELFG